MFLYHLLSVFAARVAFDTTRRDEVGALTPESCDTFLKRNLFSIIWSCLTTVILCAWTSVHPNVPPPNKWKARWNRLQLMFWMIITPELVLAWAVRQLYAAKDIRNTYNASHRGLRPRRRWTLAHGHLLGMGGFSLVDPDSEKEFNLEYFGDDHGQVLSYDQFKQLVQDKFFEFPDIREDDIHDRSKGDALSKLIAILQTTWFILQCMARGQQGLAITELELVTLALASLNAFTFAIWWHKPIGVQAPIRIQMKTQAPEEEYVPREADQRLQMSFSDILSMGWGDIKQVIPSILGLLAGLGDFGFIDALITVFIGIPVRLFYRITFPIFALFPISIILLLKIIKTEPGPPKVSQGRGLLASQIVASLQRLRYRLSFAVGKFVEKHWDKIFVGNYDSEREFFTGFFFGWFFVLPSLSIFLFLFIIFLIPFLTILSLISFIFTAVFGIVTSSTIRLGASHVPSFYAPSTDSDRWSRMAVFALFGVIFGGLHCIGWYFQYPTYYEQVLWQATSLAITVIPLVVAPIDFLLATRLKSRDLKSFGMVERAALLLLDLVMTILLFVYVPARLSLLAQALALLRAQPPSALVAVDWTRYIPHIFA